MHKRYIKKILNILEVGVSRDFVEIFWYPIKSLDMQVKICIYREFVREKKKVRKNFWEVCCFSYFLSTYFQSSFSFWLLFCWASSSWISRSISSRRSYAKEILVQWGFCTAGGQLANTVKQSNNCPLFTHA